MILHVRVFCDAEYRCEQDTENRYAKFGNRCHQKPLSFIYHSKSDQKQVVQSGCYHFLETIMKSAFKKLAETRN